MDQLDTLRLVLAAADQGSFAGAARKTGRTRDQVSKLVAQLERQLGTRLFERDTRHAELTEAGRRYVDDIRPLVSGLDAAEHRLRNLQQAPQGLLRVNAPLMFSVNVLGPRLSDYLSEAPSLRLELNLDDRWLSPIPSDADLTLRVTEQLDAAREDLVVETLGRADRRLYASPGYIERHGGPRAPSELASHPGLLYSNASEAGSWRLERGEDSIIVSATGRLSCNNGELLAQAAVQSLGIAMLPSFVAAPLLASGALVRVLEDWRGPHLTVYALATALRRRSPAVKSFCTFVRETLAPPA